MDQNQARQVLIQDQEERKKAFAQEYNELENKYGFTLGIGQLLTIHGSAPMQAQIVPIPNWSPKNGGPELNTDNS